MVNNNIVSYENPMYNCYIIYDIDNENDDILKK